MMDFLNGQQQPPGLLKLNPKTGKYEGYLISIQKVEVDPDKMRAVTIQAIKDDPAADLTDLHTITQRIAKASYWATKPNVKITPLSLEDLLREGGVNTTEPRSPVEEPISDLPKLKLKLEPEPEPEGKRDTYQKTGGSGLGKMQMLEQEVREKARHVAPYLWDQEVLTPSYTKDDPQGTSQARKQVGRLRYDQRQILKMLRGEWKRGEFLLDEEAQFAEDLHAEEEQRKLTEKLEVVAVATNGARFH